jgi:flagellar hook-associated protein FlgK
MSIFTSLYTGSSGLAAHGEAIGVVGDNIANASTVPLGRTRFWALTALETSVGERPNAASF